MINRLILLALTAAIATGCGRSDGGSGDGTIRAKVIHDSAHAGMAVATGNLDQTLSVGRVYYYDFGAGQIRQVIPAESGNFGLFAADNALFAFNRHPDQKHVRVFDPRSATVDTTETIELPDLAAGDPWDIAPLVNGTSVLLASPLGNKLQALDYQSGTLDDIDLEAVASETIRPRALLRTNNRLLILHSGIKVGGDDVSNPQISVDSTQQIYVGTLSAAGDLTLADQNPATSGIIDGVPLHASNPSAFLNTDSSSALIVGLCEPTSMTGCQAAADKISLATTQVSQLSSLSDNFPYYFVNQIVDGPNNSIVYAHVRTPNNQYKVIRIDTTTRAVTDVHLFNSSRLYSLAYDRGSDTLFVGEENDYKGLLILYQNDEEIGSIELDGVPENTTFLPQE